MELILNIGLDDIKEHINSYGKTMSPRDVAINAVKTLNFKIKSIVDVQSDTEPTIVVSATHDGDAAVCASWLASHLNQDCIAVWFPVSDKGGLYGPDAAKWGEFNPEFFFMPDGARLSKVRSLSA